MGISFVIWWWYFDGASAASEQPVRDIREAARFHIWRYAHFPLYLGIIVAGVGVQRIVTAASRTMLTSGETAILVCAVTGVMLAMTAIGASASDRARLGRTGVVQSLLLAAAMLALGLGVRSVSPLPLILLVVAFSVAQLAVSLSAGTQPRAHGRAAPAHAR
jgi:low temperature requirement protein LtrA